ncbi:hypothetical protein C8Q76DRAFT_716276 [Earliella scabrosa]|nr:hypothetical protein C8Q76DRAFT_716276 [Earliella scabrosa]
MEGLTAGQCYRLRRYYLLEGKVDPDFLFLTPPPPTTPSHAVHAHERLEAITAFRDSLHTIPHADIALRSFDNVQFDVHRTVLCSASSSLLDQSVTVEHHSDRRGEPRAGSLPVLPLNMDGATLTSFLRFCYQDPLKTPFTLEFADIATILMAIEPHGLTMLRDQLMLYWRALAKDAPLRAYYLAVQAGHIICAREAARYILEAGQRLDDVYVPEMESTPGLSYYRLLTYWESCQKIAKKRFDETLKSLSMPVEQTVKVDPAPPRAHAWGAGVSSTVAKPSPPSEPTWIRRYVARSIEAIDCQPLVAFHTLGDLFTQATEQSDDTPVWCEQCQVIAKDLIKADAGYRHLVAAVDAVELQF